MPRVLPSQVVAFIDRQFPQLLENPDMPAYSASAATFGAIIDLTDDIPDELITISGDDYNRLVFGLESMHAAVERWHHMGGDDPPRQFERRSPMFLVREALAKCPDQSPSPTSSELAFITDADLRNSIRLDMSSAADALHRGDFKAATVLAGAAIEALLLWRIRDAGVTSTPAGVKTRRPDPEDWTLGEYIKVAERIGAIRPDTVTQATLAQNYRNLIHPGRTIRLSEKCDRATALSALAGAEHVVRDIS